MPGEVATEILTNLGILVKLFVGRPTFQKKLRPNDLLVAGINSDAIYLGHKFLLPKKATEKLVNVEGRARSTLADRSIEFPLTGARFVYHRVWEEVRGDLQDLNREWNEAVEELIRNYPDFQREQLAVLDSQCETLMRQELAKTPGIDRARKEAELTSWLESQKAVNRSLYPPADTLRGQFRMDWSLYNINAISSINQVSQATIAEAQAQLQNDLQQWIRRASVEMHTQLGEAAANALNLLDKNDKLNPRNLKPLFDAFDTFKAVDFTGASSFQEVVDRIKSTFAITDANGNLDYGQISDRINNSADMSSFRNLLSKVSSLASEQIAEEAGLNALRTVGEFKRVVELD